MKGQLLMNVRIAAITWVCTCGLLTSVSGAAQPPVEFMTAGKTFVEVQTPQGYSFGIGKYEVTVSDYVDFLNAAAKSDPYTLWTNKTQFIARVGTSGDYAYAAQPFMSQRPISYLNWFDAARYVNWLHNGGGSGTTETGVYALNGNNVLITERSPQAKFWIPLDDEWREAAYGKGDRNPANDWLYATQSDVVPAEISVDFVGNGPATRLGNTANYGGTTPNVLANVGTTGGPSYYGAYDMAGNIGEIVDYPTPAFPGLGWDFGYFTRGGDYANSGISMAATERGGRRIGSGGLDTNGLRLATVPEPAFGFVGGAICLTGLAYGAWRRNH